MPAGFVPILLGSTVGHVVDTETGCWNWTGSIARKTGYGMYHRKSKCVHRFYYERAKGLIPPGYEIDHLCRRRHCVNPDHLEAVTHTVNVRRGAGTKLTEEGVAEIRRRYARGGVLQKALAVEFGVSPVVIHNLLRQKHWREMEIVA